MRSAAAAVALVAMTAIAAPALAAANTGDVPMNTFHNAFYVCGTKATSFVMFYPGPSPTHATLTTATHKSYELKASPVAEGHMFQAQGVKFWTDGQRVSVEGLPQPYLGCKLQS